MIEEVKKQRKLIEILSTITAKYIIGTILLTGLGVALPRIFHILAGSTAGVTFLPMHIAVLIAALTFGTVSASIVAGGSVIFSYLLTGMPAINRLPYMLIELIIYAVLLSLFNKKFNSYVSLIITMILGRILYAGILLVATNGLGLPSYGISVIQSVQAGIPGLIIQIACVPFIAKFMSERLKLKND